jgi:hypothetical protein
VGVERSTSANNSISIALQLTDVGVDRSFEKTQSPSEGPKAVASMTDVMLDTWMEAAKTTTWLQYLRKSPSD